MSNKRKILIILLMLLTLKARGEYHRVHFKARFESDVVQQYYHLCIWNLISCNDEGYLLKAMIYHHVLDNCAKCHEVYKSDAEDLVKYFERNALMKKHVYEYMKNKITQ